MRLQNLTFVTLAVALLPASGWAGVPDGGTAVAREPGAEQGRKNPPEKKAEVKLAVHQETGSAATGRADGPKAGPEVTAERHHRAKGEFEPAPLGGFVLGRHKAQVMLEAGYPFMKFELGYGLLSNLQLFAGYQGLYSFTSAGYAGIKLGLITTPKKTFGLSLAALGGYTHLHDRDNALAGAMVGGDGGFGEFRLQLSGRKGRHGFFFNAGMRMSQVTRNIRCEKGAKPESMENFNCLADDPVLTTVFVEAGYEVRLSRYASYFVGVGVDVFSGAWYPAMVRLRNGILFDF